MWLIKKILRVAALILTDVARHVHTDLTMVGSCRRSSGWGGQGLGDMKVHKSKLQRDKDAWAKAVSLRLTAAPVIYTISPITSAKDVSSTAVTDTHQHGH